MADNCISVYFDSTDTFWNYCWEDASPDASWAPVNVDTGLRKSHGESTAITTELNTGTAPRAWKTCQYYLRGMPAVCRWWQEGNINDEEGTTTSGEFYCSYVKANISDDPEAPLPTEPTGYNFTQCDFLGRRSWCDRYEPVEDVDPNEWICTAPNPYLTGLGEKSQNEEQAIFRPVPRKRIYGYNDKGDGTGTGLCDCHGFGRGPAGCGKLSEENADIKNIEIELEKLPIVCNFYRPYQMGFGIIQPAEKRAGDVEVDGTITEQGWEAAKKWEDNVEYRLPLNYEMYNKRAKFQKCQWWDKDTGSDYIIDGWSIILEEEAEGDPFDASGKVEFCKNPSPDVVDYNTRMAEYWAENPDKQPFTSQMALENVWARAGGPVCNGCRPDCPGYSGKWIYIQNDKMLPGMPVTANQVLELRFWSADWDSQKQYDNFYERKPNFDDASTSHIYTFTKWKKLDPVNPDKSIMLGKDLSMCQPAPLNNKEFSQNYIIEDNIEYANIETGTNAPGQYHFPSLIRNPAFLELNPLSILYPYYNDDVFDAAICTENGEAGHIKRHNTIYGDSIRSIGYTIRNKKVYVINASIVPSAYGLRVYPGVYAAANPLQKQTIYRLIRNLIKEAETNYPEYIASTDSDDTFGYFISDGVKLKYNSTNRIFICVDYGDGSWEYRWREVESVWCGGLLQQISYDHVYGTAAAGYENEQPSNITPAATAAINLSLLGGSASSELLSSYSFNDDALGATYYAWNIRWITEEEQEQNKWAAVGNSNIILAEIEDIKINYIFDWEIESAYLEAKVDIDENNNLVKLAGENVPDIVELETLIEDDDSLPPNLCLLKPKEDIRYRFFNSEWNLYITYKYKEFSNDPAAEDDEIVAGGGQSGNNILVDSPYSIVFSGNTAIISEITSGSVQLLGYFYDPDDRLIACNATKALINIVNEKCRCIDIKYQYYAEAMKMALQPEGGFCIDIAAVAPTGNIARIVETPNCGDHEYSEYKWEGPMWFPFNNCRGYDLYDEWTICNHCQSGYVGPLNNGIVTDDEGNPILVGGTAMRRNDFRYCGPHQRKAYGDVRSAIPSPCNCGCKFYFADARASSVIFSGYSRLRAPVDEAEYAAQHWRLPPFGNDGREYVEKYLSYDFKQHISKKYGVLEDWMPLVMDHSMFYFPDFDCFSSANNEDVYYVISPSASLEPFNYTNQLNLFTIPKYGEELDNENRYRWDDLFVIEHEGNCSYPLPAYPLGGGNTKAIFYYFKNDSYCWAWQEYWSDIERGLDENGEAGGNQFKFLELKKPKYQWSAYKEEHRLICTEDYYELKYIPPGLDEETGQMSIYPKLSLGNGPPRAFQILYNSYDKVQITWKDAGGDATVSGSSDEDNVYEEAYGTGWVHPENMIFEEGAAISKEDANEILTDIDELTGETTTSYYNRGLIVTMTRDRLDYLPKFTYENEYIKQGDISGTFGELQMTNTKFYDGEELIPGTFVWNSPTITISTAASGIDTAGISIAKLYIKGNIGYVPTGDANVYNELSKPTVNLIATFADETSGTPRGYGSLISEVITPVNITSDKTSSPQEYIIDINFALGPEELIRKKKIKSFTITMTNLPGYFTSLNEIKLTTAELKTLDNAGDQLETIYVWERKYLISKMDEIDYNLDGPGNYLKYDLNLKNAGQYFPFKGSSFEDLELYSSAAHSKMRSVACGLQYTEDENIDITYDTLHEVEKTTQQYYYEYAYNKDDVGDSLTFEGFVPSKIGETLESIGIYFDDSGSLTINSQKRPWQKTTEYKQFKQYDYWRPGGHSYDWSEYWRREKCYLFDSTHLIFEGSFRHYTHPYPQEVTELGETILNSYYNLRFETIVAKYKRAQILSGGADEINDLLTAANPFNLL